MTITRLSPLMLLLASCTTFTPWSSRTPASVQDKLVVHSHRGASHLPENMMTAFQCAAHMGADVIEMDLQITGNDKIVVAHDPFIKDECNDKDGIPVHPQKVFFREKTWTEVEDYDCGTRTKKDVLPVPGEGLSSLEHVLESLRRVSATNGKPIGFNIEIKYNPSQPQFYPLRPFYARHIMNVINESGIEDSRILIQSFDVGMLEEVRKILDEDPNVKRSIRLSQLIGDDYGMSHALANAKTLKSDLITPHSRFVNKRMVAEFHKNGIQVIPWTINDEATAKSMIRSGVDGVITDKLELFREQKGTCP